MTSYQRRLSERTGSREPDGPYEGIPPHLRHPLSEWLRTSFGWSDPNGMYDSLMSSLAAHLRIAVTSTYATGGISDQIFIALNRSDELFLDAIDGMLSLSQGQRSKTLASVLSGGGSVWAVAEDGRSLERRVSPEVEGAFAAAIEPDDAAANELRTAWTAILGRVPKSWTGGITRSKRLNTPSSPWSYRARRNRI